MDAGFVLAGAFAFDYLCLLMASALTRNVALFGGLIACALICVQATPAFRSLTGTNGPTLLDASQPVLATGAVAACLLAATAVAVMVGRLVNVAVGLFVLGGGVFALAGRLTGLRELVFAQPNSNAMIRLAIETLFMSVVALILVRIVFALTGGFRDIEPRVDGTRPHWLRSSSAWKSAAAGLLMIPAVWLIAQSPLKGQAIAAAFMGAMLAGLAGRLLAPHVQPILLYASPILAGALGHMIAALTMNAPLDDAMIAGESSAFARVMPLDYVAGSLLGVSFGLGWAKSFLHHEEVPKPAKVS